MVGPILTYKNNLYTNYIYTNIIYVYNGKYEFWEALYYEYFHG